MKNTKNNTIILKRKNRVKRDIDLEIINSEEDTPSDVQNIMKTKTYKGYTSIYVNSPSREIKKWFELRKI